MNDTPRDLLCFLFVEKFLTDHSISLFILFCSYKGFTCRKQLCAIDWNYHVDRLDAKTKVGEVMVTRKYNPRTKSWTSKIIKVDKDYGYLPMLMAKIFKKRLDDKKLKTNIAAVQPQLTKEIHKNKVEAHTRFRKTTERKLEL